MASQPNATDFWNHVDFTVADTTYAEVKDKNVTTKTNEHYAIYSLNDAILFDKNESDLGAPGKNGLLQIAGSINKRFKGADVKIYNPVPSGGKENTRQLGEQRANAIKSFLIHNSNVSENHISIFPWVKHLPYRLAEIKITIAYILLPGADDIFEKIF